MSKRKKKSTRSSGPKPEKLHTPLARIKVVGVGGGGGNAVSRISRDFIRGVEFIAINADHQDLDYCEVRRKIYIGKNLTNGLGTGMNPELGRQAAEENRADIAEALKGADIIFITAGFGGGCGTGGAPVVAEIAKQSGALTLAFVTKPFAFEGKERSRLAEDGLSKIKDKVDALVVVPNDRIFTVISKETPVIKAFEAIDEVTKNALRGLVELIVTPGIINVDFADVRAVIQDAGSAIVGLGIASGQDRAVNAVNQALNSPLLEVTPEGAHGVLLGISGGRDLRMSEINDAAKIVAQTADPGAKIIFGAYHDKHLKPNQLKITLVATGFNQPSNSNSLFGQSYFGDLRGLGGQKPLYAPVEEMKSSKTMSVESPKTESVQDKDPAATKFPISSDEHKDKKNGGKKQESDVWDIPTFLRRRKK